MMSARHGGSLGVHPKGKGSGTCGGTKGKPTTIGAVPRFSPSCRLGCRVQRKEQLHTAGRNRSVTPGVPGARLRKGSISITEVSPATTFEDGQLPQMPRSTLGGERSLAARRGGLRRQLYAAAGVAAVFGGARVPGKTSFVHAPWPVCTCLYLPTLEVSLLQWSSPNMDMPWVAMPEVFIFSALWLDLHFGSRAEFQYCSPQPSWPLVWTTIHSGSRRVGEAKKPGPESRGLRRHCFGHRRISPVRATLSAFWNLGRM